MIQCTFLELRCTRHKTELDFTQICNDILNHEEPIVLHVKFHVAREIRALRKQRQMRQREVARNDLVRLLLVNREL